MFKKAFAVALVATTAFTPAAFADDDEQQDGPIQEVMLSNISGTSLQIVCNLEVCTVQSLRPGADAWDREEVQPVESGMFDSLVDKYTALGYS